MSWRWLEVGFTMFNLGFDACHHAQQMERLAADVLPSLTSPLSCQTEPSQFVIGAYHQLWHIEKSFRMSKHDLQARPIYHHKRESIEAHLAVVFAALAVIT